MKKKLAVAMSVVNALNAVAPMALPYVNVGRDMSAAGGQTCDLGGVHISLSYMKGVAYAEDVSLDVDTLSSGQTQSVGYNETGTVSTMNGGTQEVQGGTGTVSTMMSDGVQNVWGGTADGARIRSASIRGSSLMAELGIRMEPTATSPWKMDIGLTGHAGKHKGVGGAVSVAYMF